jgi:hypothetical protein
VTFYRRAVLIAVSAVAVGCAAAAFTHASGTGGGDGLPPVPVPGAQVAAYCRALHAQLPARVDGLPRHDPEPSSYLVAGWGSPWIVLRCGVGRPAVDDDSSTLDGEVNGVAWSYEPQPDGSVRMTTTLRKAYVEVTLPKKYAHDGGALVDLAPAVKRTVPEGI